MHIKSMAIDKSCSIIQHVCVENFYVFMASFTSLSVSSWNFFQEGSVAKYAAFSQSNLKLQAHHSQV